MKKFLLYSLLSIVILLIGGFLYITLTPPASPLDTSLFKEVGKEIKKVSLAEIIKIIKEEKVKN